jgi:hypothetical protein
MKVIIHMMSDTGFPLGLTPVPSVREWESFDLTSSTTSFTNSAEFIGVPLEILATYRGSMIYLEGGISFYRNKPSTSGGNGMISLPAQNVKETVTIQWEGMDYDAEIEFVM